MENALYATLPRQAGLAAELEVIANNIANLATAGFRREGVIFAEHVAALPQGAPALAMAHAEARHVDLSTGGLIETGGLYDFAIQGAGFFLVETPEGPQLSRAGGFGLNAAGELVTPDGYRLLDSGGAPVVIPPGSAAVSLAPDGTLSSAAGPLAQIGLFQPVDPRDLQHVAGTRFAAASGTEPAAEPGQLMQGFIEGSNVDPVLEISRLIHVQRSYELGQSLMDREDARIRNVISTLFR